MQRFFERNREYFLAVNGEAPGTDEARNEFADVPPAGMPYRAMSLLGFFDDGGELIGVATIVADFIQPHVWHVGLFIVASARTAAESPTRSTPARALDGRSGRRGCAWASSRATQGGRFWLRCGYVQVRERGPLTMGTKTIVLRVMAKPLAGGTIAEYLALVEAIVPERREPSARAIYTRI